MEAKKTIQTAGKELDEDILNQVLGNGVGGTALGDSGQLTRSAHRQTWNNVRTVWTYSGRSKSLDTSEEKKNMKFESIVDIIYVQWTFYKET